MESRIAQFVERTGDLPSVPTVAARVIALSEDPNASGDDLREVLERDPGLAARILKVANSSLFGFPRRIETLRHAIALLGFRSVKSLALGASMKEVFKRFGLTERMLWEHATTLDPRSLPAWEALGLGPDDLESVLLLALEVVKDPSDLFK